MRISVNRSAGAGGRQKIKARIIDPVGFADELPRLYLVCHLDQSAQAHVGQSCAARRHGDRRRPPGPPLTNRPGFSGDRLS